MVKSGWINRLKAQVQSKNCQGWSSEGVVGMLEFVIMQRVVIIENYSPGARPEKDKIDGGEGVKVLRGQNMRRIFHGDTDL